ncbi:hypothetical protein MESS4_40016 [Mesorhizobium sp. STM 4661]|nr:hypothetical protein MESS4_40016 [Mesorhizobium sp. STM 4661]
MGAVFMSADTSQPMAHDSRARTPLSEISKRFSFSMINHSCLHGSYTLIAKTYHSW